MSALTQTMLAIIITFVVLGLFTSAIFWGSSDANKTAFTLYDQYDNQTGEILTAGNVTYQNSEDVTNNFQKIAENAATEIAEAQTNIQSGTPQGIILGSFGLATALTMNALFLMLAVIIEGVNMVGGITANLMSLPAPWNMLGGILFGLVFPLIFVYMIFKLIEAYKGNKI